MAQVVSGTFTATAQTSASFTPLAGTNFNVTISVSTAFIGSVALWRSFDGGVTWQPITVNGLTVYYWMAAASENAFEAEVGVAYQLICTNYVSGTITYRISQ